MTRIILLFLLLFCWSSAPQAQLAKVVYLAPYDGDGSGENPFRPRGMDEQTGCIDVRKNPEQAAGVAICGRQSLPAGTGYIELSNRLDGILSRAQRQAIESRLLDGDTLTATDVPGILVELLIDRRSGANKLRQNRDGKYHIYLGREEAVKRTAWLYDQWHVNDNGLVADTTNAVFALLQPSLAWAASYTEDWDCADNAALTCDLTWTEVTGTGWEIFSNVARTLTTATGRARAESALDTDDHKVSATMTTFAITGGTFGRCGVMGRKDGTSANNSYVFVANNFSTTSGFELGVFTGGAISVIGTSTQDQVDGDVLTLIVDGSSISGDVDTSVIVGPVTDMAVSGNLYGGIYSNGNNTNLDCRLNNFATEDLPPPPWSGVLRRRA